MKYLLLGLFFVSFFFNCAAYQPAEKIFPTFVQNQSNSIFDQKSGDINNNESSVNGLALFLNICKKNKPIIVMFFVERGHFNVIFNNIAQKYSNKANFLSINVAQNLQLAKMFLTLLQMKGIVLPNNIAKFPMLFLCSPGFTVLNNNSVSFNKNKLNLLGYGQNQNFKALDNLLENQFKSGSTFLKNEDIAMHPKVGSFWRRLKAKVKRAFSSK